MPPPVEVDRDLPRLLVLRLLPSVDEGLERLSSEARAAVAGFGDAFCLLLLRDLLPPAFCPAPGAPAGPPLAATMAGSAGGPEVDGAFLGPLPPFLPPPRPPRELLLLACAPPPFACAGLEVAGAASDMKSRRCGDFVDRLEWMFFSRLFLWFYECFW